MSLLLLDWTVPVSSSLVIIQGQKTAKEESHDLEWDVRLAGTFVFSAQQTSPLPYQLMGSFQDPGKKLVIYLSSGGKLYNVSVGDLIDNTYKVESFDAGQLELLYLPLKTRQILTLDKF